MGERKKKPGRRAYLNDFHADLRGNYTYTGAHYAYAPGNPIPLRGLLARLGGGCAVLAACAVACGCLPAAGMDNTFYILLPYAVGVVAIAAACWAAVRLAAGGDPLRAYVYDATVGKLPMRVGLCCICTALALAGECLFLLLHGFGGMVWGTVAFLLLQGAQLAVGALLLRLLGAARWEKTG